MASDERRAQALLEAVKKARSEYEERQDGVQEAKDVYYRAVRRLHEEGMPLREVASALGLSHQRVHQMIAESQDAKKARLARRAKRAAGAAGAVLIVAGIVAGAWAWTGGDDDDGPRPQPAATDRLAESPSSSGGNVDFIVRVEALQRARDTLEWTIRRLRGRNFRIETPVPGLRVYINKSLRRAAERALVK